MALPTLLLTTFSAAALIWLLAVVIRFNLRRGEVIRCASRASEESLEAVYRAIEALGSEPPNGYVLARTNRTTTDDRLVVPLVGLLAPRPWLDREVRINVGRDVELSMSSGTATEPQLLGRCFRAVAVPRHRAKSGAKARNTFDPGALYSESAELRDALAAVCPANPVGLLAYLLCAGRESFEFEPIDQARIGTSPAWVQDPDHQQCPVCEKRMTLILQVPGTLVSRKAFHRGTFYLFGCPNHPDETRSLGQFT